MALPSTRSVLQLLPRARLLQLARAPGALRLACRAHGLDDAARARPALAQLSLHDKALEE